MDTVVALACLQEEVLEASRRDSRRTDYAHNACLGMRNVLQLPPPPGRGALVTGNQVEDHKGTNGARANPFDDKLGTLHANRRVKGLCHTCGERWSIEHKCAPTVQLHVVEEPWNMMTESDKNSQITKGEDVQPEVDLMSISREAMDGVENSRTLRLQSWIQDQEVVILVDSGSSHCFISEELAGRLEGARRCIKPVQVRVANGGLLKCA